jgi:hemolysin activation/secretion protein
VKRRIWITLAGCLPGTVAWAQSAIPPSVEPGQIQRQLEEMRSPAPRPRVKLPPTPQQPIPAEASRLRFALQAVEVDGGTVYRVAEIKAAFAPLIGREIEAAEIFRIANALTARYRRDGYILSEVLVPAQSITDGRVRLLIVEGFIDEVVYRGEAPPRDAMLAAFARKLEAARPLTARTLERYLLLMNDLGGTTARGTLLPSERTQGAARLIVDFTRRSTTAALGVNNRNSRSLGTWRALSDLDWYGALLPWDRAALRTGTSFSSRLNYLGLGYGSFVGYEGARWNVDVTGVRSDPGVAANLTTTDLQTKSVASVWRLDYPLIRSRTYDLSLHLTFDSFDGRSLFASADLSYDRIRSARAGTTLDFTDALGGVNTLELEYSQGLRILDAREAGTVDEPLSRADGKADYSKLTLYAARLQSLGGPWSGLLAVTAQQAFTTLLAPELFAFGGDLFGRGYDAAEIVGDSGEAAKAELRYSGLLPQFLVPAYTFYGFFDWGEVREREPITQPARESDYSCGAGLRISGELNRWQAFVELAKPLAHVVAAEGNRQLRVFVGVQVNL